MKLFYRICAITFAFIFFANPALAVTVQSSNATNFILNDAPKVIGDIVINAEADGEITAQHGIRVMIPPGLLTIWDRELSDVNVFGTAVDAGRVSSTVQVSYPDRNMRTVLIPVEEDFLAGEELIIGGLVMRVYDWGSGSRSLEVDLDGDGIKDVIDFTGIRIDDTSTRTDGTAPYAPAEVVATTTSDGSIDISWYNPPDFDIILIDIERSRTRDGATVEETFSVNVDQSMTAQLNTYNDADVQLGDELTYTLYAWDRRNRSEGAAVSLTVGEEPEPCTLIEGPVCGSDEVTYDDACSADAAEITDYMEGECPGDEGDEVEQSPEGLLADEAGVTLTELTDNVDNYSDLSTDHWSAGFLVRLTLDEIISGYPDGTVQPDRTINRAELAKMAANAFGLDVAEVPTSSYSDIDDEDWFAGFVEALKAAEASWTTGSNYRPDSGVSRGEALWVLLTAAGVELGDAPTEDPFPDVAADNKYAPAIAWAVENSIVSGYLDGNFGPEDTLTRAQVAKIIVLLKEFM